VQKNSAGHYHRNFGKEKDILIYGEKAEYCGEIFDAIFSAFCRE
jgi:hypothetical protein